jgi:GNAT superfamily N-acetyltransferase
VSSVGEILDPARTHFAGSNFICNLTSEEAEALAFLLPLSEDYPDIEFWFRVKVVPGLRIGTRRMLRVERDGGLVGLGIAKLESDECKICTVRVAPSYANRGFGLKIFDGLLRWLDVDKPHLTISEGKFQAFERIFEWYGFSLTSVRRALYVPHSSEFGYNECSQAGNVPTVVRQTSLSGA